jgi:DNA-binding MarR family transcriptional regulator
MATTLSPRAFKRAAFDPRRAEIHEAVVQVHGAAYVVPTLLVIAQVWLAHPESAWVYPSQETIAARRGVSVRTVRRHVAILERLGLVAVYRTPARPGPGGRLVRRTNRYQFRDRAARAVRGIPEPRRRRRHPDDVSHLEDTGDPRPLDRGAVPARPLPICTPPAPEPDPRPDPDPPGEVVAPQVVAEWRAVLASVRPAAGRRG